MTSTRTVTFDLATPGVDAQGRPARIPLGVAAAPDEPDLGGDHMLINIGPQHPATHGVLRLVVELDAEFLGALGGLALWDGTALPPGLRARLEREWAKVTLLAAQIRQLEAERADALRTDPTPAVELVPPVHGLPHLQVVTRHALVVHDRQLAPRGEVGDALGHRERAGRADRRPGDRSEYQSG